VVGSIQTPIGPLPRVSPSLVRADRIGSLKARWGMGRMHYGIDPGLYALGEPGQTSPVLVTANYKMSFDRLREALPGRNLWILVLDTKGINVWCAAGKGTFGTQELVSRIESSGLEKIVSHRELILPQLSGPGVSAHEVKRLSGFKVIYGPVRAADLPVFLETRKAEPQMRSKTFNTWERTVLIPIELVSALKVGLIAMALFFVLSLLGNTGDGWTNAMNHGLFSASAVLMTILVGAAFTPLLLPWLPGRAFSVKGCSLGFLFFASLLVFRWKDWVAGTGRLEMLGWLFLIPALSAYLAMNFTGASSYTSLSGVKKEMRWALPLEIGAAALGLGLWIGSNFMR